ncbi:MAG: hypothetical protein HHAS10_09750 [Candidatus Altimarinota bacterium]
MNVIVNISGDTGTNTPPKIARLLELGETFPIPKSIYFPLSYISDMDDILHAYETLIHEEKYIVRSADKTEDGDHKSYAGVYLTKTNKYSKKNLRNDILSVALGLSEGGFILIQEYIEADFSGIYFGNIGYERSGIEYIAGGNELLTNGSEVGSSIIFDKNGKQIVSEVQYQDSILKNSLQKEDFCSYANIRMSEREAIKDTLFNLKTTSGNNIDVEWAIKNGRVYILQIRSITKPLALPQDRVDKNNLIKPFREILGKCAFMQIFFRELGFESSSIIYDMGGGLLYCGVFGNNAQQEQLVQIINSDKLYILLDREDPQYEKIFQENERNELRFKDQRLESLFEKYRKDTGIAIFLARLRVHSDLSLFCDFRYPGLFFLKQEKTFSSLLEEKNKSEGTLSLGLGDEIPFSSSHNLESLEERELSVTKNIQVTGFENSVFVGFDIRDYKVHPNIKLLLLERSSHLSHGAILAREIGIPCIYGVKGITSHLKLGQRLVIDKINYNIKICKY